MPVPRLTRRTLRTLLGSMPEAPAPAPRVLEQVDPGGIVRQKVTYVVAPRERVSAYLFLPAGGTRMPAVLCLHQHHHEYHLGKSEPAGVAGDHGQATALELAQRGYVTLAPDMLGFEERQHASLPGPLFERFEAMRQLSEGSCLQAKYLSDLQRALDYLVARPEVDPARIGCIGHSLGGQETLFLAALDRRVSVGVSSCGFSSYPAIFRRQVNHNFALYVPGLGRQGGFGAVLALVAPRPFLALAGRDDPLFPIQGVRQTVHAAQRANASAGWPLRLQAFPTGHSFSRAMRMAAYAWLDRWLKLETVQHGS